MGHAFFYPAHNSQYETDTPTPLIVLCHGGPTGQTSSGLNFKIQYWTNRGFSVVDVNYRGSTGFGKTYRHSLQKNWGIYDVEDMNSVVKVLAEQGKIDPDKTIIKGGSAGGYTALAALTFTDTFKVGVSLYGIGDLELLAKDTHKFEKYYLDSLVGRYPENKATYIERSPIHHTEKLNCAMLLFQGLEDKVVPPNQARTMNAAVEEKGLPVKLVEFSDEGHGFRNPENIEKMLEEELAFYCQVFGLK
jgi:dipeptidyl aminopeptidase/acylaminoacyl peptidase